VISFKALKRNGEQDVPCIRKKDFRRIYRPRPVTNHKPQAGFFAGLFFRLKNRAAWEGRFDMRSG
jgi:hypothetical protein